MDSSLQTPLPTSNNTSSLNTKTLYVVPGTGFVDKATPGYDNIPTPVCHYANVEFKGDGGKTCKGTLLLENPRGHTYTLEQCLAQVNLTTKYITPCVDFNIKYCCISYDI